MHSNRHIVTVIYFVIASISSTHAKTTDDYMRCYGQVPPSDSGWPTTVDGLYTPDNFTSIFNLCSALGGRSDGATSQNVGCYCTSPTADVHCSRRLADNALYDAPLSSSASILATDTSFPNWCLNRCNCNQDETNTEIYRNALVSVRYNDTLFDNIGASVSVPVHNLSSPFDYGMPDSTSSDDEGVQEVAGGTVQGSQLAPNTSDSSSAYDGFDDPEVNDVCGYDCITDSDCLSSGCVCQYESASVGIDMTTVMYMFACGLKLSGKRSESMTPCACNTTYVSYGCCGAVNGIIHETADLKLGEVRPKDLNRG